MVKSCYTPMWLCGFVWKWSTPVFFLMPKMHHSKPVQTTIYPPFWTFISIIENNSHKLDAPRFLLVFNSHLCPQTLQAMFFYGRWAASLVDKGEGLQFSRCRMVPTPEKTHQPGFTWKTIGQRCGHTRNSIIFRNKNSEEANKWWILLKIYLMVY